MDILGTGNVGTIEPSEVMSASVVLIDVREADEWTAGHAPMATHVVLSDVLEGSVWLSSQADDVVFAMICRSGARSARAAEALATRGCRVLNVAGGMRAWATAGLPIVSSTGKTGIVL